MSSMRLKGKDILLALLYSPTSIEGEPCVAITGTTRLTKAFFLFDKEIKEKFTKDNLEEMPEFIAWNFGPWSKQLIDDIEFFAGIGFIEQKIVNSTDVTLADSAERGKIEDEMEVRFFDFDNNTETDDEYSQKKYSLTTLGKRYVEEKIWKDFSKEQKEVLMKFKEKIVRISLFALIRYVYQKYDSAEKGNWTKNSVIKDQHV